MPHYPALASSSGATIGGEQLKEATSAATASLWPIALRYLPQTEDEQEARDVLAVIVRQYIERRALDDATPLIRDAIAHAKRVGAAARQFLEALDGPATTSAATAIEAQKAWNTIQHIETLIRDPLNFSLQGLSSQVSALAASCDQAVLDLERERTARSLHVNRSWSNSLVKPLALYWRFILKQDKPRIGTGDADPHSKPRPIPFLDLLGEAERIFEAAPSMAGKRQEWPRRRDAVKQALSGVDWARNPFQKQID